MEDSSALPRYLPRYGQAVYVAIRSTPVWEGSGVIGIVMALGIRQIEARLRRWRSEYQKR